MFISLSVICPSINQPSLIHQSCFPHSFPWSRRITIAMIVIYGWMPTRRTIDQSSVDQKSIKTPGIITYVPGHHLGILHMHCNYCKRFATFVKNANAQLIEINLLFLSLYYGQIWQTIPTAMTKAPKMLLLLMAPKILAIFYIFNIGTLWIRSFYGDQFNGGKTVRYLDSWSWKSIFLIEKEASIYLNNASIEERKYEKISVEKLRHIVFISSYYPSYHEQMYPIRRTCIRTLKLVTSPRVHTGYKKSSHFPFKWNIYS